MELPSEELVKEVWAGLWAIQFNAKQDKVSGYWDFGNMASRCFECWFTEPGTLKAFARGVLSNPIDIRDYAALLPAGTADACWRFIALLERVRDE